MDKREKEVLEQVRQQAADVEIPESLKPENIRRMLEEKESRANQGRIRKGRWGVRQMSALAAACIVLVIGIMVWRTSGTGGVATETGEAAAGSGNAEPAKISESSAVATAESYEQVYQYYQEYQKKQEEERKAYESGGTVDGTFESIFDLGMAKNAAGDVKMKEEAAEDARATVGQAESGGYSQTNVRQEGVDEADIAKTDGRYLYVLEDNGREIAIIDTNGQELKKVASVDAGDAVGESGYVPEFYVVPDKKKLTVIYNRNNTGDVAIDGEFSLGGGMMNEGATIAITYDIQNPEKPVEEGRVTQSGNYCSSRMAGGYLYLFSEIYMWGEANPIEPRTFVPLINDAPILEKNIYLPPVAQANMYEVITAVDIDKPKETKDSKAIFSKGGQIYVSSQNIYYYETEWQYASSQVTTVRKIAYKNGKLEAKAQGKFKGYLNDSFSIDEYDGNLRVVTTEGETNAVYVLDEDLKEIGSIRKLARDERVYSARFMGDIAYFVTFRETDPLFSVDLSDPKNPKVIGELKIPGFSEYLHFYGENRLLGIGMNVDAETMVTDGVKITMFDISDKTDVKEADTYVLKNVYSTDVSYDYKAVLVDPNRNIIGFSGYTQGGQSYFLFEYDEDKGFICNMEEDINGNGMRNARGIYIDDTLYVIQGNIIEAYSLKDYRKVDDLIL